MLVSAVIVNIKYHEYVSVTELGMSETYDYENAGFSARIDAYKCVTPEELVSMYPYTEDSLENKENIENIINIHNGTAFLFISVIPIINNPVIINILTIFPLSHYFQRI